MNKIKVVSLFSGIGGFEEGFNLAKIPYEVVFASEIDEKAKISYSANFDNKNLFGDITKINEKEIPDHDLLVAGFPCQAFSIAGNRYGFNDIRGTLFFEVARILKEKHPKYILLENVKNLVSHDQGKTIKVILSTLNDIGYTCDISIINSVEAGVPQNRERTYIVGIYKGKTEKFNNDIRNKKIDLLKKELNQSKFNSFNFFNNLVFDNKHSYLIDILAQNVDNKYYFDTKEVSKYLETISILYPKTRKAEIIKLLDVPRTVINDLDRQRRVYSIYGISPTVLARADSTKLLITENGEYKIRKVTPEENFYIQGYNKKFVENIKATGMSAAQMYKQSGNAVSPPVIEGIVKRLYSEYIKKDSKQLRFIDLFCGIGGFRIAFEKQGAECVFSCDIDKPAQQTYAYNFKDLPYGDITQIESKDIPDHDILCAGFPCQPFSIAGKRLGFNDVRGTLFFEVARILKEKKPIAFILENVKGLTNHDDGKTLRVILDIIEEIGYDCKYSVLNAKDYNVPQNRERWYCIGIRKDSNIKIDKYVFPKKKDLITTLKSIIESNVDNEEYTISERCAENIQHFVKEKNIDISPTTLAYDIRPSRCHFVTGAVSNCLTAKMGTGGNNVAVVVDQNRKLTERECLRLMGFPDTFKIGKGSQAYKQIGNSVVVPVISGLAENLITLIND